MTSKEFKWHQKSSNEIKRVYMKSKEFKWNQTNSYEINDEFTRTQMNSNEICKHFRKMWIYRDFLRKMLLRFHKWTQSPLKIEKNVTKTS